MAFIIPQFIFDKVEFRYPPKLLFKVITFNYVRIWACFIENNLVGIGASFQEAYEDHKQHPTLAYLYNENIND